MVGMTSPARVGMRMLLALAMVASLLPGLGTAAQAAVAAPTGLTPAFGTQVSTTPVLSWARVSGATRYDVEVSSQPSFSPVIFSKSTTNQRVVPTSLLPAGQVYWRVRAVDSSGAGPWAASQLTMSRTSPPVPLGPANTAEDVLEQPDEPPLLSWRTVPGAAAYQVEVDTETDFVGASAYTTKSTSFVVPDPKADGQYYWRVRAQLSNGLYTDFSTPWTYKIGPLPQVTQQAPADGAKVTDVVLEWQPVAGAKTYELQVSSDQDFNTIIDSKANIKSTRYSPATTYLNDQYYWRVRARNNQGETFEWVKVEGKKMFQRHWPSQPALQYPPNTLSPVVGDDFYFQWSPVDHATRYQLDIGTDRNFSPNTYKTCYTAGTTFTAGAFKPWTFDPCMPSQGTVYYWRVRGLDEPSDTQGIYSEIRQFIYDSGQVSQTSPAVDATVDVPVLQWEAARDAEQYRVVVVDKDNRVVSDVKTYSLAWTPTTTALDAAKSPFTWTVQAVDGDGRMSPRDGGRRFWISGASPAATAEPLAPIGERTTTTHFPVLRWQPLAGAAYYKVSIGVAGSGYFFDPGTFGASILKDKHPYAVASDRTDKLLAPGSYDWQVEAYTSAGASLGRGSVSQFTIQDLAPVTGQRLALTGTSLDTGAACTAGLSMSNAVCKDVPTTPVLDWEPVPEAAFYMVYLARDRELTNLVYTSVPLTTNSRWAPSTIVSPYALPDTQAGQAYFWFIRPCKSRTVCAPDPVSTKAAAGHAFSKTSPKALLVAPADGATIANQMTFRWQDYLETNTRSLFAPTGEPSRQSGKQYRVQVSTSPSFATFVDNQLVDQTTYTAWDKTYPEGTYYWRVQAVDASSNGVAWSETRSFVKQSPAPQLLEPAGIQKNGLVPFRWSPTLFAGSYQLEVYKNGDVAWSPTNRIINVTTKQTAYAHTVPLPASSAEYVWRVARLDADGRVGQWSQTPGRFRWSGTKPEPTTPATGATVSAASGYFAWKPVDGAVSYRYERRLVGGTSLAESVTTNATAWASTAVLGAGSWEWRVVAIDANRAEMGSSDWRSFVVLAALTATPTPTISGTAKVGVRLTAVPGAWAPATVSFAYQWFRSGVAITGATASTYVPTATDYGKALAVRVTGSKAGYISVAKTSANTAPVLAGTLSPAPMPTISGTVKAGYRLTATPGTWGPAPVTLSYQWLRSGVAITAATGSTYLLTQSDAGRQMSVRVTGRKTGYSTLSRTSSATAIVGGGVLTATPVPTVSGTAKVGYRLTAVPGTWSPYPVTLSYQWYRSGIAISGATGSTYLLGASDLGKRLTVRVTGSRAGFASVAKTSAATATVVAGNLTAPTPKISGTARVGYRLTASPGTWGPSPVTLRYQWLRNGAAIYAATGSTYVVTKADRGKRLSVRVTGSKAGYTTVSRTSALTALIP